LLRKMQDEPDIKIYIDADRIGKVIRAHMYGTKMSYTSLNRYTLQRLVDLKLIEYVGKPKYCHTVSELGKVVLASLEPEAFIPTKPEYTEDDLIKALRLRYPYEEWVFFAHQASGVGTHRDTGRYMDAWAMNTYPMNKHLKLAFEIKVSRSDFMRELKQPQKREFAMKVSNQFYFVAPEGVISPEDLPEGCGLLTLNGSEELKEKVKAPRRDAKEPTWNFIGALARRLQYEQEREKLSKQ